MWYHCHATLGYALLALSHLVYTIPNKPHIFHISVGTASEHLAGVSVTGSSLVCWNTSHLINAYPPSITALLPSITILKTRPT